eukprot:TRINITY_DN85068_c0_g1_i1.p1 TRINITY_DN85068_c0_g1~~TRINITY_DN85068_c0_g1_i1.p1  ORF type:complete len:194 (-),score=30.48 TRINITY_DN85068_c0_g1_i1:328-909(-)
MAPLTLAAGCPNFQCSTCNREIDDGQSVFRGLDASFCSDVCRRKACYRSSQPQSLTRSPKSVLDLRGSTAAASSETESAAFQRRAAAMKGVDPSNDDALHKPHAYGALSWLAIRVAALCNPGQACRVGLKRLEQMVVKVLMDEEDNNVLRGSIGLADKRHRTDSSTGRVSQSCAAAHEEAHLLRASFYQMCTV